MFVLVSWNVAGRLQKLPRQVERVVAEAPGLVCLQEVTAASTPRRIEVLGAAGLEHVALSDLRARPDAKRPLGVLSAAREPLEVVAVDGLPWPERVLAARTAAGAESRAPDLG